MSTEEASRSPVASANIIFDMKVMHRLLENMSKSLTLIHCVADAP